MKAYLTVVSCEEPDCRTNVTIDDDEPSHVADALRAAGWTSDHGTADRCPDHAWQQ